MLTYQPNAPQPFSGDETPDLGSILQEVKQVVLRRNGRS